MDTFLERAWWPILAMTFAAGAFGDPAYVERLTIGVVLLIAARLHWIDVKLDALVQEYARERESRLAWARGVRAEAEADVLKGRSDDG